MTLVWIAIGGAMGALARYAVSMFFDWWLGASFAYGTITVNLLGSFLIGMLYPVLVESQSVANVLENLIIVGFLGAFTTFSTFSMETWLLLEQGSTLKAVSNVVLNMLCCLLAVWLGMNCGRLFSYS